MRTLARMVREVLRGAAHSCAGAEATLPGMNPCGCYLSDSYAVFALQVHATAQGPDRMAVYEKAAQQLGDVVKERVALALGSLVGDNPVTKMQILADPPCGARDALAADWRAVLLRIIAQARCNVHGVVCEAAIEGASEAKVGIAVLCILHLGFFLLFSLIISDGSIRGGASSQCRVPQRGNGSALMSAQRFDQVFS